MIYTGKLKNTIKFFSVVIVGCLSILFFNTSCKHTNEYPKETTTIDSICKALKSADSALAKQDSVKIKKCVDKVVIAMDYVKMYSGKDTMSPTAVEILRTYSGTRWELQKFLVKQVMLRNEIKKSLDQLGRLKHDMENGLVKKDSVGIYYAFEAKKGRELIEATLFGLHIVDTQLPLNEMAAPQADSLVNRLKNHEKI